MGVEEVKIYNANRSVVKAVVIPNDSSVYYCELMSAEYIKLSFNLRSPVIFGVGDNITLDGYGYGRFELTSVQRPTYNSKTGAWAYTLQFNASYYRLGNRLFCYDRQNGSECSFSLTHDIAHHTAIVQNNIDALMFTYDFKPISINIDDSVNKTLLKAITYTNQSIIDAISSIAEAFECEWWFSRSVLHFGRCESGHAGGIGYVKLREGKEVNGMTATDSAQDYCTRIIAFGGECNISQKYRSNGEDTTAITNHIAKKRLMLPSKTPYIDVIDGVSGSQIVEKVYVFDDIYPRRVGVITTVTTKEYTDTNEQTAEVSKWNAFRFTDTGIMFSDDYILAGEKLKIVFQSGVLNGMIFDVNFNPGGYREKNADGSWNTDAQVWEIVRNDDYGVKLPSDNFAPAVGDKYVLYNFDSDKLASIQVSYNGVMMGIVEAAEKELYDTAQSEAKKLLTDSKQYKCPMNMIRYYGFQDSADGLKHIAGTELIFDIGTRVELINSAFFTDSAKSRVYAVERNLNGRSCTYTVADSAKYSKFSELQKDIDAVNKNAETNKTTGYATDNISNNYLKVKYDQLGNPYLYCTLDFAVQYGITAYSRQRSIVDTIMDGILVDGKTIRINDKGQLEVIK